MISVSQAQEYLDQAAGVTLPSFLIAAAVEEIEALEPAILDAGYSEAKATRVQCMAVALVAAAGAPRSVSSQGAPSGASRSFKYAADQFTAMRRALADLDTAGITAAAVGADPAGQTMLLVV